MIETPLILITDEIAGRHKDRGEETLGNLGIADVDYFTSTHNQLISDVGGD